MRPFSRASILAVFSLLLVILAVPSAASAAAATPAIAGKPWPKGSTIRIYSYLGVAQNKAVDAAIAQYNTAGAGIRLARVRSPRGAQVVFRSNPRLIFPGITDTQGRPATPRLVTATFNLRKTRPGEPYQWAMLYAHELGHVLGIDHPKAPRACTVMNPSFFAVCPVSQTPGLWTCRLLQANDRAALVRLYGGKATAPGPIACSDATGKPPVAAPAVTGFTATFSLVDRKPVVAVRWDPAPAGAWIDLGRIEGPCPPAKDAERYTLAEDGKYQSGTAQLGSFSDTDLSYSGSASTPAHSVCYTAQYQFAGPGTDGPEAYVQLDVPVIEPTDPPADPVV